MHTQLLEYFTENNLLSSQQYGFRPNRSTAGLGSSTVDQVHQVPQKYTKYKYWSSTHFFKKYLSTSSTFISSTSTSTSTHIKICSKVRMDIQSRVNFRWTK